MINEFSGVYPCFIWDVLIFSLPVLALLSGALGPAEDAGGDGRQRDEEHELQWEGGTTWGPQRKLGIPIGKEGVG